MSEQYIILIGEGADKLFLNDNNILQFEQSNSLTSNPVLWLFADAMSPVVLYEKGNIHHDIRNEILKEIK